MNLRRTLYPAVLSAGAVVVVTGAARGIGLATAHAFAKDGARVVLGDIDVAGVRDAARSVGRGARGVHVDVASRKSFESFIAAAERDVGPVAVLVNNAGMMPVQPFARETEKVSRTTIDVNLGGVLNGMRAVAPGMASRGSGHIVNVASMAGKMGLPGLAVYCASKYAVVGLSASVRDELRSCGVSVTTILPSAVDTALVSGIKTGGGLPMVSPEKIARAIVASCTHRRAEMPVPEWMRIYEPIAALMPEAIMSRVRLALGSDRLLDDASVNADARSSYDATIAAQAHRVELS
ncbi:MAG: SDR family oxidoreductase [Polyangiaceae bacterium]